MKLITNEKGIALVMVLVFSLIGLTIVSAMLFMLTQGTRTSGAFKVYKSADEASLGGTIAAAEMIKTRGLAPALTTLPFGLDACLQQKLNATTAAWTVCNLDPNRLSMDPTVSSDMTVDLPGPLGTSFRTYTKIIDTVQGNTDTSALVTTGQLGGSGVVASSSGLVSPPTIPYLYRVEVQTQNQTNPTEKARYSALYAH